MINFKMRTLGYGAIVSLALGVSGCYMDGTSQHHNVDYSNHNNMHTDAKVVNKHASTKGAKTYASKEPVQKATPGPKRAAAPQLPVIQ